jgi:predicted membrane metal-binding protein
MIYVVPWAPVVALSVVLLLFLVVPLVAVAALLTLLVVLTLVIVATLVVAALTVPPLVVAAIGRRLPRPRLVTPRFRPARSVPLANADTAGNSKFRAHRRRESWSMRNAR